jgi:ATP-binding cassette, subfamily B, bacterial
VPPSNVLQSSPQSYREGETSGTQSGPLLTNTNTAAVGGAKDLTGSPVPGTSKPEQRSGKAILEPLWALRHYLMRYPRMVLTALVSLVVSAVAVLVMPLAIRRVIDFGFSSTDSSLINTYFGMLIIIAFVVSCASATRFYAVNWLGERIVSDLRSDVFRHLATLGPAFYDKTHSGEVMSRLTADTTQLKSASGSTLSQGLRNTIMLIGAVTMMFATSVQLSGLVLLAIPLIVFPLMGAGKSVRDKSRAAQDQLADASAYASENLGAMRTLQAYTNEDSVSARFAKAVDRSFEAVQSRLFARAALTASAIFIVVASIVAVLWYGATRVTAGEMTAGRLSQFVLYATFAGAALAELAEVWGELTQAAGAASRLGELLAVQPEIFAPAHPTPLPDPPLGTIRFDDVNFAYPGRRETVVLANISFEVKRGETVALVGPSGAGKSTVFNMLLRFYDPSSGRVLVDGVDVRAADPKAVRGRMALVPQDIAIFADTITENIRYGSPEATEAEVQRAAKAAYADDFIRALSQGYDTLLGERGVTLSGGQRQRIAIARAILRNAPILLLDEATSALDANSETEVQRALEEVMRERTTLVIAHRLATVQSADRILVIDQGRIVEDGTHTSLVAKGGLYAQLAELQFKAKGD